MTTNKKIYLKDYSEPNFSIKNTKLLVEIFDDYTLVTSQLEFNKNNNKVDDNLLVLDGENLETIFVKNSQKQNIPYEIQNQKIGNFNKMKLLINTQNFDNQNNFVLHLQVKIYPQKNKSFLGLYASKNGYFTQCEAESFRSITWFLDRPDVMSLFKVRIEADKQKFPTLLANGNLANSGDLANSRHFAEFDDPFKKPCYLFALVAGKFDCLQETYISQISKKSIKLSIYVEPGRKNQSRVAMNALKKSMLWDEQRFGLECDLNEYKIVAVDDFNMGAMENKGLNIFNSKFVLADDKIATDTDVENIERVIAHEYFHNWTGNRVTCRDWFQLSLKEGLTVYREQEFANDVVDPNTTRIKDVRLLRAVQFPEDSGPMAHPVRPSEYEEINNFYTPTVYEKGGEVIRMIEELIGRENFNAGMKEYFRRYDGMAVRCEDFIAAMSAVSGFDFSQFMNWYNYPGTPTVLVANIIKQRTKILLTLQQSNTKAENINFVIPLKIALINKVNKQIFHEKTLIFSENRQTFEITHNDIDENTLISLLRNFSAPIRLQFADLNENSDQNLLTILQSESDSFAAWEASQTLYMRMILENYKNHADGNSANFDQNLIPVLQNLLENYSAKGAAFVAECLTLPTLSTLADQLETIEPTILATCRNNLQKFIAQNLQNQCQKIFHDLQQNAKNLSHGERKLKNICLTLISENESESNLQSVLDFYQNAQNMTDKFAALSILANWRNNENSQQNRVKAALDNFYQQWQHEPLVVDKWLQVQASSRNPATLQIVQYLSQHQSFDKNNPNKVYALIRSFGANLVYFNSADGSGYEFMAKFIKELNFSNPSVAARLARCFDQWKKFDVSRQNLAKQTIQQLLDLEKSGDLSKDVAEILKNQLSK